MFELTVDKYLAEECIEVQSFFSPCALCDASGCRCDLAASARQLEISSKRLPCLSRHSNRRYKPSYC